MTVSYILDSSTSTVGSFLRILFRWRGSVWKSVLVEMIVWIVLYYIVFSIYRFSLDTIQQKMFESIGRHIDIRLHLLPLTFMLGFFVTIVVDRWKNIFQNIGFIDSAAFYINTYIRGDETEVNNQRRTLLRYLCLTQVLVLRDISVPVRKRFPNLDSLVDSGLLKKNERELLENIPSVGFNNYWIPINWIFVICYRMRLCGNIVADMLMNAILNEVKVFKEVQDFCLIRNSSNIKNKEKTFAKLPILNTKLQILCNYDWVPVPLAYPQVVFLAVRIYFLLCLVSRQYRINEHEKKQNEKYLQIDRIIPLMTILELFFIMGWVKVAEALLNPLGEDDDDFECNFIIDRNIAMAMTMAEMCYDKTPEQIISEDSCDDLFNPKTELAPLYAESIATHPQHPLVGSATLCNLPEEHLPVRMVERQQELKRGSNVDDSLSNTNSTELSTEKGLNLRRFSNISMKKLRNMRQSISIPIQPRFCGGKLSKISEKQIEQIKNGWSPDNLKNTIHASERLDETLERQNDINTTPARV
uniref:Bestrophin homolog n=1 Tax=Meloidogyne incognita TaxID=6306 RepID=A0A914N0B7_MELIC